MNNLSEEKKEEVIVDVIISAIDKKWNIYQLSKMIGRSVADTSKLVDQICIANPHRAKQIRKLNWPRNINVGHIYTGSYSTPVISNPDLYKIDNEIRLLIKNKMISPNNDWLPKAKELIAKKHQILKESPTVGGSICHGERLGHLKIGDHVFAQKLIGKPYSEIYLPISTKQYLFRFGYNLKRDNLIKEQRKAIKNQLNSPDPDFLANSKKRMAAIRKAGQNAIFTPSENKAAKQWFSKEDILNDKLADYAKSNKYTWVERMKPVRIVYTPGKMPQGTVLTKDLVSVNSDGT